MDLLNYIKEREDLSGIPTGIHAVVPDDGEKNGLPPGGRDLCAAQPQPRRQHQPANLLHPYCLAYVRENGEVVDDHTRVKAILDLARAASKHRDQPITAAYKPFNQATDDGRDMTTYSALLDRAIAAIVQVEADKDVQSVFTGRETTALTGGISGLEDFELVCFLIVQEAAGVTTRVPSGDPTIRTVLFDYPARAAVGNAIPKSRIVARTRTRGLRDRLGTQVAEIRWAYKLARVSLNLAANAEAVRVSGFSPSARARYQDHRRALAARHRPGGSPSPRMIKLRVRARRAFPPNILVRSCFVNSWSAPLH